MSQLRDLESGCQSALWLSPRKGRQTPAQGSERFGSWPNSAKAVVLGNTILWGKMLDFLTIRDFKDHWLNQSCNKNATLASFAFSLCLCPFLQNCIFQTVLLRPISWIYYYGVKDLSLTVWSKSTVSVSLPHEQYNNHVICIYVSNNMTWSLSQAWWPRPIISVTLLYHEFQGLTELSSGSVWAI